MRKLCALGLLCLFSSCDWLASKEVKTKKLVSKEMQSINWNDVDQYPLFLDCDETASKEGQRACFENTLLTHFSMALQDFEFIFDEEFQGTAYVDFLVDNDGTLKMLKIEKHDSIDTQMPEFDGIIARSLKSLPRVEPALKRGIPVSAKFRIPIVLTTN
ncbi:hypothetical protein [Spongiimicrobium sp. 3-5]|uniref:hypothetical protein n=1 Tax=Spongiimicrobium sp. 3-5 TaxID=3332596 RepID=UPI00397FC724